MLTDDSILTLGKYKFSKVGEVPITYLKELAATNPIIREDITIYLNNKMVQELYVSPPIEDICKKRYFPTKEEARRYLKKVRESKGDHKKPNRAYECPHCSGWHLTSMPIEFVKKNKK